MYLYETGLYLLLGETQRMIRVQIRLIPLILLTLGGPLVLGGPPNPAASGIRLPVVTMSQAKQRLSDISAEQRKLAPLSMRGGIGATGYRSQSYADADHTVWIQLNLDEEVAIDQIVLVPTIWRHSRSGYRADGFPMEFHIMVGGEKAPDGIVIARYGAEDLLLPRVAPVVINCPRATKGSWVRVVATSLSPRLWDDRYDLQLSEIMVFSDDDNVALQARVDVSSDADAAVASLDKRFLVDGHVPYLMDSPIRKRSIAFVSKVVVGDRPQLTIDLGETHTVNRVHLHAPDTSETVPQSHGDDFAVPKRMQIIGATQSDFSDADVLCDIRIDSVFDTGPIIMRRFPAVPCRYIRLTAVEPFFQDDGIETGPVIGFAEIEVFSGGRNVALKRPIDANFKPPPNKRRLALLTDGRNFYGDILPIRAWMNQLARRHELQSERPRVLAELDNLYVKQSTDLRLVTLLAAVLTVAIGFILLITRIVRLRQLSSIKERFAADLHDELGANLHTIGLLSDLADDAKQTPDELATYLQRIRALTERTGIAMRHLVDVHDAQESLKGFLPDMRHAAERIVVDLDHEISVEGEQYIERLKPRTRVDLLLFYKECLVNISRHSGATRLRTQLVGGKNEIHLTICDNGCWPTESSLSAVPPSLLRRAKLLGAMVELENPDDRGTRIHLNLRTRRWGFRR